MYLQIPIFISYYLLLIIYSYLIFQPNGNPPDNRTAFNCSGPICPSFAPYKVYTKEDPDPYCSADDVRVATKL